MTGNGQDRPEKGAGKERAGRAGCPHKRRDVAGALLRATALRLAACSSRSGWTAPSARRRGGEAAMASLLVSHDASSIAPSSRLALTTSPPRHGRCRSWVQTLRMLE